MSDSSNVDNEGKDKMASIANMRPLRKKFKRHVLPSFRKLTSVQTIASFFVMTVERIKRPTKFELELKKSFDCFLIVFVVVRVIYTFLKGDLMRKSPPCWKQQILVEKKSLQLDIFPVNAFSKLSSKFWIWKFKHGVIHSKPKVDSLNGRES